VCVCVGRGDDDFIISRLHKSTKVHGDSRAVNQLKMFFVFFTFC
jgi:hypothetical protein